MTRRKMLRESTAILGPMLLLTVLQSYGIAQLDQPYVVLSILAVSGGSTLGLVASLLWVSWLGRSGHSYDR